jgi:hypothetical protein
MSTDLPLDQIVTSHQANTPLQMNYAIAFLGLIFVFAAIYWVVSGRKFYAGPVIEADIAEAPYRDLKDDSSAEQSRKELKDEAMAHK